MSFSKKELAETAWAELQRRRANADKWLREKKMTPLEVTASIEKMQAIYRLLVNLPDEAVKMQE